MQDLVQWFNALVPGDQHFMRVKQNELYPHLNTRLKLLCNVDTCAAEYEFELDIDAEFFR